MNSLPPDIRLCAAGVSDAPAISELIIPLTENFILKESSREVREPLLRSMSAEGITRLMKGGCEYHLARREGELVGVLGIHECHHLYHLFVAESAQGLGIARALWSRAMQSCLAAGEEAGVTVNAAPNARAFYERLGFVACGEPRTLNGIVTIPMEYTTDAGE